MEKMVSVQVWVISALPQDLLTHHLHCLKDGCLGVMFLMDAVDVATMCQSTQDPGKIHFTHRVEEKLQRKKIAHRM